MDVLQLSSLAVTSLPPELDLVLRWIDAETCERKICARVVIKNLAVFGPVVAPRRSITPDSPPTSVMGVISLDLEAMDSFNFSFNEACNWMKFVRYSMNGVSNLEAVQCDEKLFFVATRDIAEQEELVVSLSPALSQAIGKFADIVWQKWVVKLDRSAAARVNRNYSHVHLGILAQRVGGVLQESSASLEVFRERCLQIDHTGADLFQKLMRSQSDRATWPALTVHMKHILQRVTKWLSVPAGARTATLLAAIYKSSEYFPPAIALFDSSNVFLLSPLVEFNVLANPPPKLTSMEKWSFLAMTLGRLMGKAGVSEMMGTANGFPILRAISLPTPQIQLQPDWHSSHPGTPAKLPQPGTVNATLDLRTISFAIRHAKGPESHHFLPSTQDRLEISAAENSGLGDEYSFEDVFYIDDEDRSHVAAFLEYMAKCESYYDLTYSDGVCSAFLTKAAWIAEQQQSYALAWLQHHEREVQVGPPEEAVEQLEEEVPDPRLNLSDNVADIDADADPGPIVEENKLLSEREARILRRQYEKEQKCFRRVTAKAASDARARRLLREAAIDSELLKRMAADSASSQKKIQPSGPPPDCPRDSSELVENPPDPGQFISDALGRSRSTDDLDVAAQMGEFGPAIQDHNSEVWSAGDGISNDQTGILRSDDERHRGGDISSQQPRQASKFPIHLQPAHEASLEIYSLRQSASSGSVPVQKSKERKIDPEENDGTDELDPQKKKWRRHRIIEKQQERRRRITAGLAARKCTAPKLRSSFHKVPDRKPGSWSSLQSNEKVCFGEFGPTASVADTRETSSQFGSESSLSSRDGAPRQSNKRGDGTGCVLRGWNDLLTFFFPFVKMTDGKRVGDCRFCGMTKAEWKGKVDGRRFLPFHQHTRLHPEQKERFLTYPDAEVLDDPSEGVSTEELKFPCNVCDTRWATNSLMLSHRRLVHLVGKQWCCICLDFVVKSDFEEHVDFHRNEDGLLSCRLCNKAKPTHYGLILHASRSHAEGQTGRREHQCEFCLSKFDLPCRLRTHIKAMHPQIPADGQEGSSATQIADGHQCSVCRRIFSTVKGLNCHFKVRHSGKTHLPCGACEHRSKSLKEHKAHMKTHFIDGVHHCPKCPKTFISTRYFCAHLREHSRRGGGREKDMPPPCDICGKQMQTHFNLKQHKQLSHGINNEIPGCRLCGHPAKSSWKLKLHFRSAHPDEEPGAISAKDNPFKETCTMCFGVFSNRSALSGHQGKIHWQELGLVKPQNEAACVGVAEAVLTSAPCHLCGKTFKSSRSSSIHISERLTRRRVHLQSQHGVGDLYRHCAECGKFYFAKVVLQKHYKKEHLGRVAAYRDARDDSMKQVCSFCSGVFFNTQALERHQMKFHEKAVKGKKCRDPDELGGEVEADFDDEALSKEQDEEESEQESEDHDDDEFSDEER